MRVASFAFVAFIAAPVLALPHTIRRESDARRALARQNPVTARGMTDSGVQLEERANRPTLKIETKNPCESGEYAAIPNISGLECSRRQPYAFLVGGYCYLPSERDFAAMGPVEKGTCFVFKAK
ncbi:hypothetical protein FPV67DRAFT_1672307 [Lyophyllum atratum]|nr:hypothetical protein FPV67DRAFT_1672307 [Lyophyllum atratum]